MTPVLHDQPSICQRPSVHDPAFRAALDLIVTAAAPAHFALATTPSEREAIFRLRAQVVIERHWRPASDFPDGMERVPDDDRALHLAGWIGPDLVAAARMIEPTPGQLLPNEAEFDLVVEPRGRVVHLDRLIVVRRQTDPSHRLHLALLAAAARETLARGYDVWTGIESRPMIRLLRLMGFPMQVLGPDRPYWGEDRHPVRFPLTDAIPGLIALTAGQLDPASSPR